MNKRQPLRFTVRLKRLFIGLLLMDHLLILFGCLFTAYGIWTDGNFMPRLVSMFDLNVERNFPSTYSAAKFLVAALLLYGIAIACRASREPWKTWAALSALFVFLSLDEFASIHERLIPIVRSLLDTDGYFFHAWVIPYGILVLILLFVLKPFLVRLEPTTRRLFIIAGVIFVAGAIGFELLESNEVSSNGRGTVTQFIFYTIEEYLEMLGLTLFVGASARYLVQRAGQVELVLQP